MEQPLEEILEQELREIAAGIAEERWCTESYKNLESAIDQFLDGGEEENLWDFLDELEASLERSSESYQQTDILAKEVTVESLVLHKLLLEGIEQWQSAVAVIRQGDPECEPEWAEMLARAQEGNRLLVAVQIYYGRLQRAVSWQT